MDDYQIIGPGTLAHSNVLEQVAQTRIRYGFGLDSLEPGAVLVAPADCKLLNRRGWLIAGGTIYRAQVVDCENGKHRGQMKRTNLLADVSIKELSHKEGWLILED